MAQSFEEREASIDTERRGRSVSIFRIVFLLLLTGGFLWMSAWVVILKNTYEPGVHVHIVNKTGNPIKDLKLTFSWCELRFKVIVGHPPKSWEKPHGAIIRHVDWLEGEQNLDVQWTDASGVVRTKREKDLYLNQSSPLVIVTFNPDGTVTVECRSQGLG